MTLIAPALLLLGLGISGALMVSLALSTRLQVHTNNILKASGLLQAQNELEKLKYRLASSSNWDTTLSEESRSMIHSIRVWDRGHTNLVIASLTSSATVQNTGVSSRVSQAVMKFPVLVNRPVAALTQSAELTPGLPFTLIIDLSHTQFSLWSRDTVDITQPNQLTCTLDSYLAGDCEAHPLSNLSGVQSDVVFSDNAVPEDLMEYLFGVDAMHYAQVRDMASIQLQNQCPQPSASGLIWINGDCTLASGTTLGTNEAPVLLVIHNGNLALEPGAHIVGLAVSFRFQSGFTYRLTVAPTAMIRGAVVTNHPLSADSNLVVQYDQPILSNLQNLPQLQHLLALPGTWRDF